MEKGRGLSEVRISVSLLGCRKEISSTVSHVWEPQTAEGKLSVLQGIWDIKKKQNVGIVSAATSLSKINMKS